MAANKYSVCPGQQETPLPARHQDSQFASAIYSDIYQIFIKYICKLSTTALEIKSKRHSLMGRQCHKQIEVESKVHLVLQRSGQRSLHE